MAVWVLCELARAGQFSWTFESVVSYDAQVEAFAVQIAERVYADSPTVSWDRLLEGRRVVFRDLAEELVARGITEV